MTDFSDILIMTDLDKTFFGDGAVLVQRNIDAIERFKQKGGFFTIATGRVRTNINKAIPGLASLINAPMECCNGAVLYDVQNSLTVAENPLSAEAGLRVIRFLQSRFDDVYLRVSVREGLLFPPEALNHSEQLRRDVGSADPGSYFVQDYAEWGSYTWYKIVFRGECAHLDAMRDALEAQHFDGINVMKSGPTFLEIQGSGVDKAAMIPVLSDYCGKKSGKKMKVYACGDYENDIAMMRAADYGVCPANALDSVKAVADYCFCDNNRGLIADLIEMLEAQ